MPSYTKEVERYFSFKSSSFFSFSFSDITKHKKMRKTYLHTRFSIETKPSVTSFPIKNILCLIDPNSSLPYKNSNLKITIYSSNDLGRHFQHTPSFVKNSYSSWHFGIEIFYTKRTNICILRSLLSSFSYLQSIKWTNKAILYSFSIVSRQLKKSMYCITFFFFLRILCCIT